MSHNPFNTTSEEVQRFLKDYYHEQILEVASEGGESLVVNYSDVYTFNTDTADGILRYPSDAEELFEEALNEYDMAADVNTDFSARFRLPKDMRKSVIDIEANNDEKYVAVEGRIAKSSGRYTRLDELEFKCSYCDRTMWLEQDLFSVNEPERSCDCEYGSWEPQAENSSRVNHVGFELQQPPGEAAGEGESIVVHVDGDLVYRGDYLPNHTGQRVVVHGTVEVDATELTKRDAVPKVEEYLNAQWIEFKDGVADDTKADKHLDTITELASRDDAPQLFAESILPEYWGQDRMDEPLLGGVAFLFGSYELSPDGGRDYRGDVHGMYVGDPGTGKSSMAKRLAEISMRCESVSGPQVTGPGLTASASQDSFAGSNWTLTPGVLPRADGGHVVIDELDKAKGEATEALHDALENPQQVKVAKANQRATMSTKVGLLATANPADGRFNKTERWGSQLNIDDALFTRFDFIFAFKDRIEESRDRHIAESIIGGMHESAELERKERGHTNNAEQDITDQPVSDEVLSAWVAHARDNCYPEFPTGDAAEKLVDYYVDARGRNDDGDGESAVPTGPRTLQAGVRLSVAFARCRLAEKVEMRDVELAIELTNRVMADLFFDPQTGEWNSDMPQMGSTKTQEDKVMSIFEELDGGAKFPSQVAQEVNIKDEEYVRERLQQMASGKTDVPGTVEEKNGKFRRLA